MTQPDPGLVLEDKVFFTQVHADANGLRVGKKYLAWDDAGWIAYWGQVTKTSTNSIPTGTQSDRTFAIGGNGNTVSVTWTKYFGGRKVNPGWQKLIEISERYLVPRLVDRTEARIRDGKRLDFGKWVMYERGFYLRIGESRFTRKWYGDAVSLVKGKPVCAVLWSELANVQFSQGNVCFGVIRNGQVVKMPSVGMKTPNAVLWPALAARFCPTLPR